MKQLLFIFFLLAALVSCIKQEAGAACAQEQTAETVDIEFTLDGGDVMNAHTKSATQAAEAKINNFQILVFNQNSGALDAYGKSSDGSSLSIKVSKASGRKCFAVVNSSKDLSEISMMSEMSSLSSELKDNSLSGLEMIGSVSNQDFTTATTCTIPVKRFVAKVAIDRITAAFSSAAHAAMTFKVKGIYLINVNGECLYDFGVNAFKWYNPLQYVSGECDTLLSDTPMDVTVTNTSPMNTPHYFYCYANPTKTDTNGGTIFSPRFTRLVIETTLGGTTYYYPVNIIGTDGELKPNTFYEITNLTITGLGSDSPDVVPQKGSVSFSVTVTDWSTGFNKEVEY